MAPYEPIDERRADAVWQRVSPDLNPYPEARRARQGQQQRPQEPPFLRRPTKEITEPEALAAAIGGELAERRAYQQLLRRTPQWARRPLEQLAAETLRHARRLMGVYFLLTGERYQPAPPAEESAESWLTQLRRRYQRALQSADQYARWAKSGGDGVLAEVMEELASEKRRHARTLLGVLENALAQ